MVAPHGGIKPRFAEHLIPKTASKARKISDDEDMFSNMIKPDRRNTVLTNKNKREKLLKEKEEASYYTDLSQNIDRVFGQAPLFE